LNPHTLLKEPPEGSSILVVEDDDALRQVLVEALATLCLYVHEATTLADALRFCAVSPPDLVLLDLGLPDGDGAELLVSLRAVTAVPLIVLSGREDEDERVALLDAGADDFITKPCSAAELLARVRGLLRRSAVSATARSISRMVAESVEIDLVTQRVTRDGVPQRLTPTEWSLLRVLALHAGRALTPRQLWDLVWDREFGDPAAHVRVHITHLRRKIEPNPAIPRLIVTEPGVGYRFVVP
jgi:two-component system, OmpR family, KDP operon response regulator KdpE